MSTRLILVSCAAVLLAGCAPDPREMESTPVEVATRKGAVTCQLYTRELVLWDRAIARPDDMGVEEADSVCRDAGRRWRDGEPYGTPVVAAG